MFIFSFHFQLVTDGRRFNPRMSCLLGNWFHTRINCHHMPDLNNPNISSIGQLGRDSHSFPWKSIWKVKATSKVAFFTWTAVKGKILTLDNLGKRNICVVNRCCMCRNDWVSVDHLLLHCPNAVMPLTCGHLCLACLVFHGLYLNEWLSC